MKKIPNKEEIQFLDLQNKIFYITAKTFVKTATDEEIENKIKELEEKGYEYNKHIEILLSGDITIPYEFVLLCLLKEK
jgi:hypothetical protein